MEYAPYSTKRTNPTNMRFPDNCNASHSEVIENTEYPNPEEVPCKKNRRNF
jgi:hypothetical protein